MKLYTVQHRGKDMPVLLDSKMRIIKPVYYYLKHLRLKDRAVNTLKASGNDLKIYWEFLNSKDYEYNEVNPNVIGEFIEYLRQPEDCDNVIALYQESKRTGTTINRILSTVYNFYKYCGMVEEVNNPILMEDSQRSPNMFKSLLHHAKSDNKTKKSIFKVKESKKAPKLVSDDEAEIFLEGLRTWRDQIIFKLLYLAGARVGEVLDLQIEDIPVPDSSEEMGVLENIKSKGKFRDLYIPMPLLEEVDSFILEERMNIDTEHSYIFVSQQKRFLGKPLTYQAFYDVFDRVKEKTGTSFTPHDLRHSFVTYLAETGMDMSAIMILAGHKHLSTTEKYTHLSKKYIKDSLSKYWDKSVLIGGGASGS